MLNFILGMVVGGCVGWTWCALLSSNGGDK